MRRKDGKRYKTKQYLCSLNKERDTGYQTTMWRCNKIDIGRTAKGGAGYIIVSDSRARRTRGGMRLVGPV